MAEIKQRFRFLTLLLCLVFLILVLPFVYHYETASFFTNLFYSLILFISVYVLAENKKLLLYGLLLAVPNLLITLFGIEFDRTKLTENIKLFSSLAVTCYVTIFFLHTIFKSKRVTSNILYASTCVYLLLGLAWSTIYVLIELNMPGSFTGLGDIAIYNNFDDLVTYYSMKFLYFSYITLTTLGYGNIYPVSNIADAFTSVEALTGQLFLAILIGRLLGMHIAQSRR